MKGMCSVSVMWDEIATDVMKNINDEDNFEYLEKMKKKFVSVKGYTNIEEGFENY